MEPLYEIVYLNVYVPAFVNVYELFCALLVPSSAHETVIFDLLVTSIPSLNTFIPGSVYKIFNFAVSFKLPIISYVSKFVVSGSPLTSIVIPELCVIFRLLKDVFTIYVTFFFCLLTLNVVFAVNPSEFVIPVELSLTNTS